MNKLVVLISLLQSLLLLSSEASAAVAFRKPHHGVFARAKRQEYRSYEEFKREQERVVLNPAQSCYYQTYNYRLTCNCNSTDTAADLHLKMSYFVYDNRNEIREVYLHQCKELKVKLDFRNVDATNYPVTFRAIRKVEIEKILFEPAYSHRQELELSFDNVDTFEFNKVYVEDTLKITANNVKEARIYKSTFAHIPVRGFEVSRAKMLEIRDSQFMRVSPMSIVVEKTKVVRVVGNEMTLNALEVVVAKDGSHLVISCNRLTNHAASPECTYTTTTLRTTTTPAPTTTTSAPIAVVIGKDGLHAKEVKESDAQEKDYLAEIIGGTVAGLILITVLVVLFIVFTRRKRKRRTEEPVVKEEAAAAPLAPAPPPEEEKKPEEKPDAKEDDPFLLGPEDVHEDVEDEEEDHRPKIRPPIWLEEIQQNRIFNRQKSLLSEDNLKAALDPQPKIPEAEEPKESSRTESADEEVCLPEADIPLPPPPPPPMPEEPAPVMRAPSMAEPRVNGHNGDKSDDEMENLLQKVREQERALKEETAV